jgi:hypothetical protein
MRNTYADSDVVLGTMNPYKLDLDSCCGYNLFNFGKNAKYLIGLKLMKSRLGEDNIMFPLFVNPGTGTFECLPRETVNFNYDNYKK